MGRHGLVVAMTGLAFFAPTAHAQQPEQVTVPDLKGMSVKAANRALERAGLHSAGERLELSKATATRAQFAPAAASRRVRTQSARPGVTRPRGTVIAVGTSARGDLQPIIWQRIAYAKGRVILRLAFGIGCSVYDHAALGAAADDGARVITVWARTTACGRRPPDTLVLDVKPSWTRSTIGVPWAPTAPDAAWNAHPRLVSAAAMLMPDRRTILATYTRSACERMSAASATIEGKTVTLRVVAGFIPGHEPEACILLGVGESVLIKLPAHAPAGTTFVNAAS